MDNLEIIQNLDKVIIFDNSTQRKFLIDLDKKIPIYGFSKFNQKEILLNKLLAGDYGYYENMTSITIEFNVNNKKKECTYIINCEEIFPDIDVVDINAIDIPVNELKKVISSLKHKVENLESKLKEKDNELKQIAYDNLNYF